MKLLIIHKGNRDVCDVLVNSKSKNDTAIVCFLAEQPKETSKSAKGVRSLFKRYASLGRNGLTASLFHEVDKNDKIWEFIKGKLRILCFIDGRKIILTNGYIKKTPKVAQSAVKKAVSVRANYHKAKKERKLEVTEK